MSLGRLFAVLFALVAVGLGIWFVMSQDAPAPTVRPRGEAPNEEPSLKPEGGGTPDGRVVATPFDASPEATLDTRPVEVGPEDGVRVAVIDGGTNRPVAGIDVWYVAFDSSLEPQVLRTLRNAPEDPESLIRAHGRRFRTDALGVARVPKTRRTGAATARSGTLVGIVPLTGRDTVRLTLNADADVAVQVVDAAGTPQANVDVIVQGLPAIGFAPIGRGTTAAETGTTVFRHLRSRLALGRAEATECVFSPDFPVPSTASVTHAANALPKEPVRLVLPPFGSLQIETVDAQDAHLDLEGTFMVALKPPGEPSPDAMFGRGAEFHGAIARGRGGMDRVGTGTDFDLTVVSTTHKPVRMHLPALTGVGEARAVRVRVTETFPAIVGRIVEADGTPLASASVPVQVEYAQGNSTTRIGEEARTDAAGRFRVQLTGATDPGVKILFHVMAEQGGGTPRETAEVPALSAQGDTDIGDVRLGVLPVLVSGRIVDDLGRGLPSVPFMLETETLPSEAERASGRRPSMRTVPDRYASDRDGNFEVRSRLRGEKMAIAVNASDALLPTRVEFTPGQTGVQVVVPRAGVIEGSVRLPPNLPGRSIHAFLRITSRGGAGGVAMTGHSVPLDPTGTFRITNLPPGVGTFSCTGREPSNAFVSIPDVEIKPGEVTRDPRLQGIDLTNRVRALKVSVVDEAMRPVEDATVVLSQPDARSAVSANAADARAGVVVAASGVDVTVYGPRFRTQTIRGVVNDLEVTMAPALQVKLVLSNDVQLPAPPLELAARLMPVEAGGNRSESNSFDATRSCVIAVGAPGPHRVQVRVVRKVANGTSDAGISLDQRIEVRDASGVQVFEIQVPQVAIDRAAANLKE